MRWQQSRRSSNVEDRRGARVAVGGGGLAVAALVIFLLGGDPTSLLIDSAGQYFSANISSEEQQEQADFVSAILGGTEDSWNKIFQQEGKDYVEPTLVLFSGIVSSSCGTAQSAIGPFYCPLDQKVYLDLSFFYDLEHKLDAPGDFARAYVVAHEIGHHVQKLQGTSDRIQEEQRSASAKDANQLSVRLELQADCYAGIWAHFAQVDYQMLEAGDVEEALNAASQIGDDRLQEQGQGYVVPDSFTHGTSAQRHSWFQRGLKSGKIADCDTFASKE